MALPTEGVFFGSFLIQCFLAPRNGGSKWFTNSISFRQLNLLVLPSSRHTKLGNIDS